MASSSSHQESERESQLPNSQGSAVDARSVTDNQLVITFNSTGQIIRNKDKFKTRCLTLLKIQVGLEYDNWKNVDQAIKDDMWKTLSREFVVLFERKEDVLKEMSVQLKSWRWNTRKKNIKDLDVNEILALKDNVPPKEKLRLSQWNAFIDLETSEKKLEQRKVMKANRALKVDVHCLGRTSYAEKGEEMKEKDPDYISPSRSQLYLAARKRKNGETYPAVAETCQKIKDLSSSYDSSSQVSLDDDPVSQVLGKNTRGTTHGVGRVGKGKVKAVQPLKTTMEQVVKSNQKYDKLEKMLYSMHDQVSGLVQAFNTYQNINQPSSRMPQFSPQPSHGTGTPSPSTLPLTTPSPTSSPKRVCVNVRDTNTTDVIAQGYIIPTEKDEKVHGRTILPYESKVEIICVENDAFGRKLYLDGNAYASTVGEVVGGYVVWPTCFLEEKKE